LACRLKLAIGHPGEGDHAGGAGRPFLGRVFGGVIQPFDQGRHAARAGVVSPRSREPFGREDAGGFPARGVHDLPRFVEQRDGLGTHLLAQALQLQHAGRVGQAPGSDAGLVGCVARQGVERAAAQVEPGFQGAFDAHVEPGFDAAGDELVGDRVDQQAGHQPHQAEDAGQLEQQAAAELAGPEAQRQSAEGKQDDQPQQRGHGDVGPEEPAEVTLQAFAVLGGEDQQEGEDEPGGGHGHSGHDQRPAVGLDGAHGALGTGTRRSTATFQSVWPPRPICNGRGNSLGSSMKRNTTSWSWSLA